MHCKKLRFNWEAVTNTWNQWVLNYSPDRQREAMERLGMKTPTWQDLVIAMMIGAALVSLVVTGWLLKAQRERDPVQRLWERFCKRIARTGVTREPAEGPLDFARRAAQHVRTLRPESAAPPLMQRIAETYAALRYGPRADAAGVRQFAQMVKEFSV